MINIVCLKWGTLYSYDYVNKLYSSILRNTTVPFHFHCFTENTAGIDPNVITHPLPHNGLDGWWNKLYLFSNEMPIRGRIFFVDLDTLITGNVDNLLSVTEGFVVLRDFFHGLANGVHAESIGSGLMSYDAGTYDFMWKKFIDNPKKAIQQIRPHGDQRYIQNSLDNFLYWQDLYPNQVVSFKVHCNNGLAKDARIVCYHGKPSIPESINTRTRVPHFDIQPQPWVEDHWKE